MKPIKFGIMLVAVLCLLTSSASAESLQEALKAGTFNGKLSYFMVYGSDADTYNLNGTRNRNSSSVAAKLKYVSGDFHDFKLGMSFQASHDLKNQDAATESLPDGEMDTRAAISAAIMNELYLDYSIGKTEIKAGRQIIHSPLLNNSEWPFPMGDSFDAVVVTTNVLPKTMLKAMYVKEFNTRTSEDVSVHFSDPLLSVFVSNKSISDLTLIGQYLTTSNEGPNGDNPVATTDGWDTYLLEGNYKLPIEHPLIISLKYGGASFDNDAEEDTNFYGVRVKTNISDVALEAAYTSVDDQNAFPGSYGHVPNSVFYNNMLMLDSLFAGVDTWSLKIGYNFGVKGLDASLMYTSFSQSEEGMADTAAMMKDVDGASEIDLLVKYNFSGAFSGLSTHVIAGLAMDVPPGGPGSVDEEDNEYVRFLVQYAF